ncbi:MAG: peptidoglycan-binding domain-containing protein [Actinomycetia bacterium]|nr:peptidoglycan-binding domain-containing protein [Actinomycetes bacterium]
MRTGVRRQGSALVAAVFAVAGLGLAESHLISAAAAAAAPARVTVNDFTTVPVARGSVESVLPVTVRAEGSARAEIPNQARGTVTSIDIEPGQSVDMGDVLYRVGPRPSVIARGPLLPERRLYWGLSGDDVAQLQVLLEHLGLYTAGVDGLFGPYTAHAVYAWQNSHGLPANGYVERGDVVYLDGELPQRVTIDTDIIRRGAQLFGGEPAITVGTAEPVFALTLSPALARLISSGTPIEITGPNGEQWHALTSTAEPAEQDGVVTIAVTGRDDANVCDPACPDVHTGENLTLEATAVLVEPTQGLRVPIASLGAADGGTPGEVVVYDSSGAAHPVEVLATAGGMAIVESPDGSVTEGMSIRLPAIPGEP